MTDEQKQEKEVTVSPSTKEVFSKGQDLSAGKASESESYHLLLVKQQLFQRKVAFWLTVGISLFLYSMLGKLVFCYDLLIKVQDCKELVFFASSLLLAPTALLFGLGVASIKPRLETKKTDESAFDHTVLIECLKALPKQ